MNPMFKFIQTLSFALFFCSHAMVLHAQQERLIEVQGHSINVFTSGWEHIKNGVPTVIFDGGSTVPIEAWENVLTEVAKNAPVVAFDPPGTGKSEWDGRRPTLSTMNERLYAVLEAIEAKPPYILVGHSWAGWLVRGFAGRYPDEVAGLVLIDPTPSVNEFLSAFKEIGVGASGLEELTEITLQLMDNAPPPYKERQSVIAEFYDKQADPEVPKIHTVPVAFLVAGKPVDASLPNDLTSSFDMNQFFEVLKRHTISSSTEWILNSPGGFFVITNKSGHCIHCEDPELVVWAIHRLLFPEGKNQ